MTYPIPPKALEHHLAFLGKTGSGKTTAAKAGVEGILDGSGRVCVIDPTGAWWGMKSSASGKSAGFPFVIFGGSHADFPLSGAHGEALAEIVGTSNTPAIIDTSQLKVSERSRFFTDFADAIMRKNRGPLHLVVDEAHLFMPQGKVPDPQSGQMLAAGNNMVSGGRSRGLRIMLITQRPAKLHKDSLTQVETLVAMRLIAPQDRNAVEEWIEDNADDARGREIISSLATLKTGEAWVWAPELDLLERVKFPRIRTFDSSAAPDGSETGAGPVLARVDADAIKDRLSKIAADVVANDPKILRARIAELERRGKTAPATPSGYSKEHLNEACDRAEREGEARGRRDSLNHAAAVMRTLADEVADLFKTALTKANKGLKPPASAVEFTPTPGLKKGDGVTMNGRTFEIGTVKDADRLVGGQAKILAALIQYPDGLTREQLTVLAGYKRSTRDLYLQQLTRAGLVEASGGVVVATDKGRAALPDAEPLPTGVELQRYWLERLPAGERKVLEVLLEAYPAAITGDYLSERSGYLRSTRDLYVQQLARRQLCHRERGQVRASENLFS